MLCDRGISSPRLWQQIRAQGWHPGMRYRNNITFCAHGGKRLPARRFVSRPDTAWIGRRTAFSAAKPKRRCTLLVVWYAGQAEPCIILTHLPPDQVWVRATRSLSESRPGAAVIVTVWGMVQLSAVKVRVSLTRERSVPASPVMVTLTATVG